MKNLIPATTRRGPVRVALPALAVGAAALLIACATIPPPTEAVAVSKAAVAQARAAGAAELAPAEMNMAREKLDRATVAMTALEYPLALSLANEAEVDARLAETKAQSVQAKKAADEVQENIRVLREEINRKSK
jgi:hypothetical protein